LQRDSASEALLHLAQASTTPAEKPIEELKKDLSPGSCCAYLA